LDLADRMGFVVMDEAFDAWRRGKKKMTITCCSMIGMRRI
jgi:beta-galactosidase/beta-glucuronidase